MLTEKFFEVVKHEGVVSITSCSNGTPHVVGTWNSYLSFLDDNILIPVASMESLQGDLDANNKLVLLIGARAVEGYNGYQGTGFRIEGVGKLMQEGPEFQLVNTKFAFAKKVLVVTPTACKQLL